MRQPVLDALSRTAAIVTAVTTGPANGARRTGLAGAGGARPAGGASEDRHAATRRRISSMMEMISTTSALPNAPSIPMESRSVNGLS